MAELLGEYDNAPDSHAKLAEVLESGNYPLAECRVNLDKELPYEVWSSHDRDDA